MAKVKTLSTLLGKLWQLIVVLAQIAGAYVFTTQNNLILLIVGVILGASAGITLVDKFINGDN